LINALNHLKSKYFSKIIYRESIFGDEPFICIGWADIKRTVKKIHVFGFPKKYSTKNFHYNLKENAIRLDPQLMLE
jgi:hypothetical protein